MTKTDTPSFLTRLWLALVAPFRLLFDARFAAAVVSAQNPALPAPAPRAPEPAPAPEPPAPRVSLADAAPDAALQLLGLFQREGRFVDFLMEDVSAFSDADIGAAARVVHDGCKRAVDAHFTVGPVRTEEEGSDVAIAAGYDAHALRLTGNVVGDGPYRGTLAHRGWRVTEVRLPKLVEGHDARVLAPAEVELA
ncbi:MAG: DUF2760 domain-containing protein [Sandaracinaceae bacterium]|nr:DUF2760 domain-containing protein [Myxococcales bacterium]MCB9656552.1 DUF2760 domain-containing protein [Sandaracinaceae bacterium]